MSALQIINHIIICQTKTKLPIGFILSHDFNETKKTFYIILINM